MEDVKSILDKVLKVLRRYLLSFLSYRDNTGRGNIYAPPPTSSAARVNAIPMDLTPQEIERLNNGANDHVLPY